MRKGLVGPFEVGTLSALAGLVGEVATSTGLQGCNIEGIYYSTAFQAGIDNFVIPEYSGTELPSAKYPIIQPRSEFVKSRLSKFDSDTFTSNYVLIKNVFSDYLPDDWQSNKIYEPAWTMMAFITELLSAMKARTCLLTTHALPAQSDLEKITPPELHLPFMQLVREFQNIDTPSTAPSFAIERDSLTRYQEIVLSDLFEKYVGSGVLLDDDDTSISAALDEMLNRSRALVSKNQKVLSLHNSTAGLLRFTPKIIDTVFGKLPGVIADLATAIAEKHLNDNKRIVVYCLNNAVYNTAIKNLIKMLREADNGDVIIDSWNIKT